MKFIWITDPHFDHVAASDRDDFLSSLRDQRADGIFLTGDLSEGDDVTVQLRRMAEVIDVPISFVLGNHDFYGKTISATRRDVIAMTRDDRRLIYLADCQPIQLCESVFLIGDDGWGDGTIGDYEGSSIRLRDFTMIDDFVHMPPEHWRDQLRQLGLESAERLRSKFDNVPAGAKDVIVLTHIPPFREACWYEGRTADDMWAPFFVCGEVGRVLQAVASERIGLRITVLCGHTHHDGVATIADNLVVHTGASAYGMPAVEAIIDVGDAVVVTRSE